MALNMKTRMFLDRPEVERMIGRVAVQELKKTGAYMRAIARNSLKYPSKKRGEASQPGQVPLVHRPYGGAESPLKRLLFFEYDPSTKSVVIGPAIFPQASGAPNTLEFGGQVRRYNPRRRIRQIGDAGEIRVMGRASRTTKRQTRRVLGSDVAVDVTYAKLTTQAQADRANDLNEHLYGPLEEEFSQEPRPFMRPAMLAAAAKPRGAQIGVV